MALTRLASSSDAPFPPVEHALDDGLLSVGGDLSAQRLLNAYQHGVFPWFNKHDPILWWSPDPRMVLFTDNIKLSKSLKKTLRTTSLTVSFDRAFRQVITACAQLRSDADDSDNHTWIHPEMIDAYTDLHEQGYAHSVECWQGDKLVGGLYGIAIGHMFFGESMFSSVRDSSKIAFVTLCQQLAQWGFPLIDCQVYSSHLESLGAEEIDRADFITMMTTLCEQPRANETWQYPNE
ncbi:MAG: leucyl/phenylalanyl-tRNA--protein transferase [Gammaproteobacteria bacterium]|nr:MAG: leucyl/phenylalanyl-tRNA--protein transferase [Gammaproteobacteria bacterium]